MKKAKSALWVKIVSWVLSLALVLVLAGGVMLTLVQTMLTDTTMHERVAANEQVLDRQMVKIEARIHELAQEHHFMPQTVLDLVSREAVAQYGCDVVAWWTGMFGAEPETEVPEFDVSAVQTAVRADELFKENTAESLRLRIARDEVAYEVGAVVKDAVIPIRTSLVEIAAPMVLAKVDMPRLMALLDTAKTALTVLCGMLLLVMMLLGRGPAGMVYAGAAAAAAGMLLLLAGLGVYALDLPGMIAPLSKMFEMQFEAFQGEMMMKLLIKGGTALLGGQILAGMSLWMMRRMERKQAA